MFWVFGGYIRKRTWAEAEDLFPSGVAVVIRDGVWPHFCLIFKMTKAQAEAARIRGVICHYRDALGDHSDEQGWIRGRWSENEAFLLIPKRYMALAWIWVFSVRLVREQAAKQA